IESEKTSQTDNSLEVNELLEDNLQTKGSQANSKKYMRHYKTNKKSASCWKYFKIVGGESVCDVKIKINGKEKNCGKKFKYLPGWSTTNMNSHLADEHDIAEFQKNQNNTKGSQQTITTMLQRVVPHKGTKKFNICHAVAEWLVIDNRPFEVISGEGFRRFMLQIDFAFRRPSYKTLKKEISIANTTTKSQINNLLARSSETISLTTDLWTARNKTGYIGITAH
ncbi:22740_t:CDS:2, partial [Racocetra persica]